MVHSFEPPTMNSDTVMELVVYRLKPNAIDQYVEQDIDEFRRLVMSLDGCTSYHLLRACRDDGIFADIVVWESLDVAEAAAKAVNELQKAPKFCRYLAAFENLELFTHLRPIRSWSQL